MPPARSGCSVGSGCVAAARCILAAPGRKLAVNEELFIVHTAADQPVELLTGPAGLDMTELRRQFAHLYDHGETDEWLEYYRGVSDTCLAPTALALVTFLDEIHCWRQSQLWFDSAGSFDACFLNWLLLEYACTPFPLNTYSLSTKTLR